LILVVDDEVVIASVTAEFLKDRGFAVITCDCTASALLLLDTLSERPSGLVVDVHFKDGSTGFEVAAAARERFPDLAVIYTSGAHGAGSDARSVSSSRFVGKPYDSGQLAELLAAMIDSKDGDPELAESRNENCPSSTPISDFIEDGVGSFDVDHQFAPKRMIPRWPWLTRREA
jgi:DNA-binding NtrC family response regulator